MIKKIGLSKHIENDTELRKKIYFKKNIKIHPTFGQIKEIQSIIINVVKINEELKSDSNLNIFFAIELKIVFLDYEDSRVRVLNERIFHTESIYIEKNILRHEFEDIEIFIENIKVMNESPNDITIAVCGNIVVKIIELDNLYFIAKFNSRENNIYKFNKMINTLEQCTFLIDNYITEAKIYYDDISFINNNELCRITDNKLSLIDCNDEKEYSYLEPINSKEFIIGIAHGKYEGLYTYKNNLLKNLTDNVIKDLRPLYLKEKKELVYFKFIDNKQTLMTINLEEVLEKNIISFEKKIKLYKFYNGNIYLLQEDQDNEYILIYNLEFIHLETIKIPQNIGIVLDIKVSSNNEFAVLKILGDSLVLFDFNKSDFRQITNNNELVTISSFEIDDLCKNIFICDNSFQMFNIYKLNLRTLEKKEFINVGAIDLEFI